MSGVALLAEGSGLGGCLPGAQLVLCPPLEKKMPDLPGAPDEAFDRRFVKWLMKNKVGQASAGSVSGVVVEVVRCSRVLSQGC